MIYERDRIGHIIISIVFLARRVADNKLSIKRLDKSHPMSFRATILAAGPFCITQLL